MKYSTTRTPARQPCMAGEGGAVYAGRPEIPELLAEMERLAAEVEAAKVRMTAVWRDVHALGGMPAITGWTAREWLEVVGGLSGFEARRFETMSQRLPALPVTAVGLLTGRVTFEQAAVICERTTVLKGPLLAEVDELAVRALQAANERGDVASVTDVVDGLVQARRPARDVERAEARARNGQSFWAQPNVFGGGALSANLDDGGFDAVVRAVEDAAGVPSPDVPRRTQRAEGLVAMATAWLGGGAAPATAAPAPTDIPAPTNDTSAPTDASNVTDDGVMTTAELDEVVRRGAAQAKPSVTVLVDLAEVTSSSFGTVLQSIGRKAPRLTARLVDTLTCAGDLTVMLTEGARPLLELKDQKTIPAATRRAIILRDRGCRMAGCARPAWMCDVHHIVAREDGGDHDPDNLALVCREHHVRVHGNHWHAFLNGDTGAFSLSRRKDGSNPQHVTYPLGSRPPPVAVPR